MGRTFIHVDELEKTRVVGFVPSSWFRLGQGEEEALTGAVFFLLVAVRLIFSPRHRLSDEFCVYLGSPAFGFNVASRSSRSVGENSVSIFTGLTPCMISSIRGIV